MEKSGGISGFEAGHSSRIDLPPPYEGVPPPPRYESITVEPIQPVPTAPPQPVQPVSIVILQPQPETQPKPTPTPKPARPKRNIQCLICMH